MEVVLLIINAIWGYSARYIKIHQDTLSFPLVILATNMPPFTSYLLILSQAMYRLRIGYVSFHRLLILTPAASVILIQAVMAPSTWGHFVVSTRTRNFLCEWHKVMILAQDSRLYLCLVSSITSYSAVWVSWEALVIWTCSQGAVKDR